MNFLLCNHSQKLFLFETGHIGDQKSGTDLKEDAAILPSHHFFGLLLVVLFVFIIDFASQLKKIFVLDFFFLCFNLFGIKIIKVDFAYLEDLIDV